MYRKPSLEKHTPLGIFFGRVGANSLTSSPTPPRARSVTTQTFDLRVPTNVATPCGPTAIWRAIGAIGGKEKCQNGRSVHLVRVSFCSFAVVPWLPVVCL